MEGPLGCAVRWALIGSNSSSPATSPSLTLRLTRVCKLAVTFLQFLSSHCRTGSNLEMVSLDSKTFGSGPPLFLRPDIALAHSRQQRTGLKDFCKGFPSDRQEHQAKLACAHLPPKTTGHVRSKGESAEDGRGGCGAPSSRLHGPARDLLAGRRSAKLRPSVDGILHDEGAACRVPGASVPRPQFRPRTLLLGRRGGSPHQLVGGFRESLFLYRAASPCCSCTSSPQMTEVGGA